LDGDLFDLSGSVFLVLFGLVALVALVAGLAIFFASCASKRK
jgi:hypothetical protein